MDGNRKDGGNIMIVRYKMWDKQLPVNGKEPEEILSQEQIEGHDEFILFMDEQRDVVAIECVATIKEAYNLPGEDPDEIAAAYIEMRQNEQPKKTIEEQLAESNEKVKSLDSSLEEILFNILPNMMGI